MSLSSFLSRHCLYRNISFIFFLTSHSSSFILAPPSAFIPLSVASSWYSYSCESPFPLLPFNPIFLTPVPFLQPTPEGVRVCPWRYFVPGNTETLEFACSLARFPARPRPRPTYSTDRSTLHHGRSWRGSAAS